MANAEIFSMNQWKLAIKPETTIGTINDATMQLVNIDSAVTITDNPHIVSEYRTGEGRTKKSVDHFASEKGQVKSISFSGIADTTVLPILLENWAGITEAAAPSGVVAVPYNFTGTAFSWGDANAGAANTFTLTVALDSPIAANTRVYPGCVVDDLVFTDDVATDGGRRHFSCTLLTRGNPTNNHAILTSPVAYGTTYYSIYSYSTRTVGDAVSDKVISKVELTLKSNPRFFGLGTNGVPEIINRGYPGIEASAVATIKYDANSMEEFIKYPAGTSIQMLISDNATIASAAIGFSAGDVATPANGVMKLTSDLNLTDVEDGVFLDISAECLAGTAGYLIQIAI